MFVEASAAARADVCDDDEAFSHALPEEGFHGVGIWEAAAGCFAGALEVFDEEPFFRHGGQGFEENFVDGSDGGRGGCGERWGCWCGWRRRSRRGDRVRGLMFQEEGADAADHFEVAGEFGFEFREGVRV